MQGLKYNKKKTSAAGIFKSVVSIILIVIANQLAKRAGEERLF